MAFADYLDLRTAVVEEVGSTDIVDKFDRITKLAESWFNRSLRTRAQISTQAVTVASGVATLPSDYAAPIGLFDGAGREMVQRPYQIKGQTTIIGEWAVDSSQIIAPDADYTLHYYAKIPTITSSMAGTNWLLQEYPGLYLWGVVTEAFKSLGEPDKAAAAGKVALQEHDALLRNDASARYARARVMVGGPTP